jgi:hypothetical protein
LSAQTEIVNGGPADAIHPKTSAASHEVGALEVGTGAERFAGYTHDASGKAAARAPYGFPRSAQLFVKSPAKMWLRLIQRN